MFNIKVCVLDLVKLEDDLEVILYFKIIFLLKKIQHTHTLYVSILKSDRIENNGNGIHDKRTDEMTNIVKSLLLCTPAIEMFSVSVLMLGPSKCNNQYLLYLFVS